MGDYFEIGATYDNPKIKARIFILAVAEQTEDFVWLATLNVDRETYATSNPDERQIFTKDFSEWEKVTI